MGDKELSINILKNKRTNQLSIVLPKKKIFPKNKKTFGKFLEPKRIKIKEWEFEW